MNKSLEESLSSESDHEYLELSSKHLFQHVRKGMTGESKGTVMVRLRGIDGHVELDSGGPVLT